MDKDMNGTAKNDHFKHRLELEFEQMLRYVMMIEVL